MFGRIVSILSGMVLLNHTNVATDQVRVKRDDCSPGISSGEFKNWGIEKINAPAAWARLKKRNTVRVAIIDTGIEQHHADLSASLWTGRPEYGWDFIDKTINPSDSHGHGTHVAGIIGGVRNPLHGTAGVAKNVEFLVLKYFSQFNSGAINMKNSIDALRYAVSHGARIINYSGGGEQFSEDEFLAIKYAQEKGVLVVAAAGNYGKDVDSRRNFYYPAAYKLDNTISVTSMNPTGGLLESSNYGAERVDLAAPGEDIYSTWLDGGYSKMTGSSQATAFVTGIAALILSEYPELTPSQVKTVIRESVEISPELIGKTATSGYANACRALEYAKKLQFARRIK